MRRFTTLKGETLGVTFSGDKGRTVMFSGEEEKLLWSLDEDDTVLEDEALEWTLSDLKDFFHHDCHRATDEELERRGWLDRKDSGLGFRLAVGEDGRLFTTR